jgi:glycerol-3-phosphate dehydrogenase
MTDFAADLAASYAGGSLTKRTGATSGDTVPAGAYVVWVNSGAGSHTITLTNNKTDQGLTISSRIITVAATGAWGGRVDPLVGDASGRVAVAINGTAAEVTYYVVGGI